MEPIETNNEEVESAALAWELEKILAPYKNNPHLLIDLL